MFSDLIALAAVVVVVGGGEVLKKFQRVCVNLIGEIPKGEVSWGRRPRNKKEEAGGHGHLQWKRQMVKASNQTWLLNLSNKEQTG